MDYAILNIQKLIKNLIQTRYPGLFDSIDVIMVE